MTLSDLFDEYWPLIVLTVGAAWGGWREIKKTSEADQHKRDDRDVTIAERELSYSGRLENRIANLEPQRVTLEKDKETLQTEVIQLKLAASDNSDPEDVLRHIVDEDPGIMWIKKRRGPKNFVMLRVSRTYATTYLGGPQNLYDGKTDADLWDKEIADMFTETDEKVYVNQVGEHIEELIIGSPSGAEGIFKGRKYAISLSSGDYVIGTGVHIEES